MAHQKSLPSNVTSSQGNIDSASPQPYSIEQAVERYLFRRRYAPEQLEAMKMEVTRSKPGSLAVWQPHEPGGRFDHVWYWKKRLPDRKGHPCRVNATGEMDKVEVEFEDGFKVITSRWAVRKK